MFRFSGTPLDCSFVFFSPQQTLVECDLAVVVVAVEKWKAFCAFQFSMAIKQPPAVAAADGDSSGRWTAVTKQNMRFVQIKTEEQLDVQAMHR